MPASYSPMKGCAKKAEATAIPGVALVTDPHLFFTADAADELWWFRLVATITSHSNDQLRFQFLNAKDVGGASEATLKWEVQYAGNNVHLNGRASSETEVTVAHTISLVPADHRLVIEGVVGSLAAGAVAIRWRKNADVEVPDTSIEIDSYMVALRLG